MLAPSGAYYVSLSAHGTGAEAVGLGIPRPTLGATVLNQTTGATSEHSGNMMDMMGGTVRNVSSSNLLGGAGGCSGLTSDLRASSATQQSRQSFQRLGTSLQRLFATGVGHDGGYSPQGKIKMEVLHIVCRYVHATGCPPNNLISLILNCRRALRALPVTSPPFHVIGR